MRNVRVSACEVVPLDAAVASFPWVFGGKVDEAWEEVAEIRRQRAEAARLTAVTPVRVAARKKRSRPRD